VIAKGFTKPTARVEKLKKVMVEAIPRIESERAVLVTEAYKETEGLPIATRRAKAAEKIFNNLPITIRDDELVVGSITKSPRAAQIYPEFSFEWVPKEFESMESRLADPFVAPKDTVSELAKAFEYWPGKTINDLAANYMSAETKDSMASGIFTVGNYFFGGVGHVTVNYGKILQKGFRGVLSEAVEALEKLDRNDPEYIKKQQFLNSVIIVYSAAINFAHRYAAKAAELASIETNPARKAELLQIAQNCTRVPEHGATTFWEACQAFWFVQILIQIEGSGHSVSPGRFDQYMNPFLLADKSISREFAQELVDCIWIKLNDISKIRDEVSAQAFAGYGVFQNLCVGGQTEDGVDATNEMSYMCFEATAHVALPQPSFSIRVCQGTPDEFLYRASEVVRLGFGVPAMYNDEVIIPALVDRGVRLRDARNYNLIGCVEPTIPGKTEGWHDAAFFNIAKILEIALNNGKILGKQIGPASGDITTFKSIDDFIEAYRKQMEYFVHHLAEACNSVDYAHAERGTLPFLSAMVEDCIRRGKPMQEGGAVYNFTGPQAFGVADTGDSVYAIQKNVFEDGKISLLQLKKALDANFGYPIGATLQGGVIQGGSLPNGNGLPTACAAGSNSDIEQKVYEIVQKVLKGASSVDLADIKSKCSVGLPLQGSENYDDIRRLLDSTPGFGNDIDEIDYLAKKLAQIYCHEVDKYRNPRGGQFQAGIYPVSANVLFGKDVLALPDGRLAKTPLADGVSPRAGKDVNGPTAAANSVAKLDHHVASNGTLYNQKFIPSALAGDKGLQNFAAMVRSYFDRKGMHVQFNVIDRETMLEAQRDPEHHRDLVVRVAGYSAQFVVLAKEVQDDIISRTELSF
jgi:formate C-acetyltransferase